MRYASAAPATPRVGVSWIGVVYLVIGGIISGTHSYWAHPHTAKAIVSALLAIVLWPLVLLGVNLHIH